MCFQLHSYRRRNVSSIEVCTFGVLSMEILSSIQKKRFFFSFRNENKKEEPRRRKKKLCVCRFLHIKCWGIMHDLFLYRHYDEFDSFTLPLFRIKNNINAFNNSIDRTFALNVSSEFNLFNSFGLCLSCSTMLLLGFSNEYERIYRYKLKPGNRKKERKKEHNG